MVHHYHKYPSCVKLPFAGDGKRHSPIIGFAFDGFPLYGPYEATGVIAKNLRGDRALDVCNGHKDEQRGYHNHVTPIQFELTPENVRRTLPTDKPSWVQIGPFDATKIEREGDRVTAEITIPDDAPVGILFDCHLEFGCGASSVVIKKNDVFRVAE